MDTVHSGQSERERENLSTKFVIPKLYYTQNYMEQIESRTPFA